MAEYVICRSHVLLQPPKGFALHNGRFTAQQDRKSSPINHLCPRTRQKGGGGCHEVDARRNPPADTVVCYAATLHFVMTAMIQRQSYERRGLQPKWRFKSYRPEIVTAKLRRGPHALLESIIAPVLFCKPPAN